jgi:hypothetical protein
MALAGQLAGRVWGTGVVLCWAALIWAGLAALPAAGADTPDQHIHEGVASCAGANCHGRLAPSGPVVRQNELFTWQDPATPAGEHSRASKVLTEPRARAIADKLSIAAPEKAPECLGCHADPAPAGLKSAKLQVTDGVTCEACHGGAHDWLASHYTKNATHAANLAAGMIALDDPKVRAITCLGCHYGSDRDGQFVSHRLMAAGHPRLSFELDLFTSLQAHHTLDADYAKRKQAAGGVKTWAVGQALALDRAVSLYSGPAGQDGVFPQLYFFDCHACHRRISDQPGAKPAALANPARPTPVGTPVFNDENMIMLAASARLASPALADQFEARSRAFHASLTADRPRAIAAAADLAATSRALADAFAGRAFSRDDTFVILDNVLTSVLARYTDFEGSAQGVMATDTLLAALVAENQVPAARVAAIRPDLERAYAAVRDPNTYDPTAFRATFQRVASAARGLR